MIPRSPGELSVEQRINLEIDSVLRELGITDPSQIHGIKNNLRKDLARLFTREPHLAYSPTGLRLFLTMHAQKHYEQYQSSTLSMNPYLNLIPNNPKKRKEFEKKTKEKLMALKQEILRLIQRLQDEKRISPALAKKLEDLANRLDPAAPQKTREQAAEEFRILLMLEALLLAGKPEQLEKFVAAPDFEKTDAARFSPIPKMQAVDKLRLSEEEEKEALEKTFTNAEKTIIDTYGMLPDSSYQQAPKVIEGAATIAILAIVDTIQNTSLMDTLKAPGQPIGDGFNELQEINRNTLYQTPKPSPYDK